MAGAVLAPVRRLAAVWRTTRRTAARVPDVVDAILVLPSLATHIELVGLQTANLVDMQREIARMREDTAALARIDRTLEQVAVLLTNVDVNTAAVEQLAEVMLPLQGAAVRVGRVADRWPARVPGRAIAPRQR